MVNIDMQEEERRNRQKKEEKDQWYKYRERRRAHRYYKEDGYVSEAESIDIWRERARRSAELINEAMEKCL